MDAPAPPAVRAMTPPKTYATKMRLVLKQLPVLNPHTETESGTALAHVRTQGDGSEPRRTSTPPPRRPEGANSNDSSSGAKSAATKEGATQPEQSGVETEVVEEEHDVALVVNWDVKPDLNLAQEYQKLKRPMYKKIAVEVDGEMIMRRVPLDPVDAVLDDNGFLQVPKDMKDKHGNPVEVSTYPWWDTTLEDFGCIGGTGMRLYFTIVQLLSAWFFSMGLLSLPSLIMNFQGDMYEHEAASQLANTWLAQATLGSLRAPIADLDAGNVGGLWVRSWLDALGCALLAAIIFVMDAKKQKVIEMTDWSMITMGDYSVWITAGTSDTTWPHYGKKDKAKFIKDLRHYLETTICDKKGKYVKVADILEDGKNIPAIWPAFDEDENIVIWNKKMAALYGLESAIATCVEKRDTSVLDKPIRTLAALNKKLAQVDEACSFFTIAAFVSFELDDDYETALEWQEHKHRLKKEKKKEKLGIALDAEHKKVLEEHGHFVYPDFGVGDHAAPIDIKQAPEPEVLMWAHLEYRGCNLAGRIFAVNMFAIVLLAVGAGLILGANYKKEAMDFLEECSTTVQQSFAADPNNGTYCDGLPMASTVKTAPTALMVEAALHYKSAWEQVNALDPSEPVKFPEIITAAGMCSVTGACCDDSVMTWNESKAQGCLRADKSAANKFLKDVSRDAVCYACLCAKAKLFEGLFDDSNLAGFCDDFTTKKYSLLMWFAIASLAVVVVNQGVKLGMETIIEFERSDTSGGEQGSLAIKIFLAQFMNTGILLTLLRADIAMFAFTPAEKFANANARMYAKVLAPLMITMMACFMAPPCSHIGEYQAFVVLKKLLGKFANTQNQLNLIQEDEELKIASSYGEVLMGTAVVLMYSSAMPLLNWIAGFGFLFKYSVDKYAVVTYYKKPPLYGHDLFESIEEIMFMLLILHSVLATYFYSMAGGEHPNETIPAKIRPHAYPMLVTSILLLAVLALKITYRIVFEHTRWGKTHRGQLKAISKILKAEKARAEKHINAAMENVWGETEFELKKRLEQGNDEGKGEVLVPFTEALNAGLIVNEDDDYHMDEHENIRELEVAFMDKIEAKWAAAKEVLRYSSGDEIDEKVYTENLYPFNDVEIAKRIYDACKNPIEDGAVRLEEHAAEKKRGRWDKVKARMKVVRSFTRQIKAAKPKVQGAAASAARP